MGGTYWKRGERHGANIGDGRVISVFPGSSPLLIEGGVKKKTSRKERLKVRTRRRLQRYYHLVILSGPPCPSLLLGKRGQTPGAGGKTLRGVKGKRGRSMF